MAVKTMAVIGSTGSTGSKAIKVADSLGIRTKAICSYGNNPKLFIEQVKQVKPDRAGIVDEKAGRLIQDALRSETGTEVIVGPNAVLKSCVWERDVDTVFNATVGVSGLVPTIETLKMGIDVRLVNKQSLVVGGEVVMETAERHGAKVYAVDSEHCAAFQCLQGNDIRSLTRLVITMSGGALRDMPLEQLRDAKPEDALKHPNWVMGPDVTIKCANGMNKLEEMVEAMFLFDLRPRQIAAILHRQSKVHAITEYTDKQQMWHVSESDMWYAIQNSLTFPERRPCELPAVDLAKLDITFREIDLQRYPILEMAPYILTIGGTMFAVAEGAGTQAVVEFLKRYGKHRLNQEERHGIRFTEIAEIQRRVILEHKAREPTLGNVLEANRWAANRAAQIAQMIRAERKRKDFAL